MDEPLTAVAALADTAEGVNYWGGWSALPATVICRPAQVREENGGPFRSLGFSRRRGASAASAPSSWPARRTVTVALKPSCGVALAENARVFEIDEPRAWQRLVTDYPRTATATYRHNWAWTGWDGEWLVPDWPAVAADWDGIHLSVAGYLSTAGRALPVGTARMLLAGWNPDETYWLTDAITSLGEVQAWHNPSREPLG
jgi:hypothetical protein